VRKRKLNGGFEGGKQRRGSKGDKVKERKRRRGNKGEEVK